MSSKEQRAEWKQLADSANNPSWLGYDDITNAVVLRAYNIIGTLLAHVDYVEAQLTEVRLAQIQQCADAIWSLRRENSCGVDVPTVVWNGAVKAATDVCSAQAANWPSSVEDPEVARLKAQLAAADALFRVGDKLYRESKGGLDMVDHDYAFGDALNAYKAARGGK